MASDIAVFIELSIDFVSNVDIMLKNSGFKIAFFMTVVKLNDNRELKTGYQDFRVVAVVIRLSNPFFHHRAQKTILLVLHQE